MGNGKQSFKSVFSAVSGPFGDIMMPIPFLRARMKILPALFVSVLIPAAAASDTFGYLAFWENPDKPEVVTVTKTTQEDADELAAKVELDAFCRAQDAKLDAGGKVRTGCQNVTALRNSCAAAAWPGARGLLKHNNVVVAGNMKFAPVAEEALAKCRLKYGEDADCQIETVFCTSSSAYGGGQPKAD